ncbi:hypothetical protein [Levilactobacillus brevis]|uniref:hypothetical protein n=1 Tax=Levilactobacillus brevis TaxID=1580 RepID=UPI00111A66F7|nr:hypothetical protein [Levilactobacillus brevis]QCZ46816.1 Hypothetical protein UCCLB556_1941 [Levilactobacillus brevis]
MKLQDVVNQKEISGESVELKKLEYVVNDVNDRYLCATFELDGKVFVDEDGNETSEMKVNPSDLFPESTL